MLHRIVLIVLLAAASWSTLAEARGLKTIRDLHYACADWNVEPSRMQNSLGMVSCAMVIQGFSHGVRIGILLTLAQIEYRPMDANAYKPYMLWCIPDGVNNQTLAGVFMKWADRNPARWHEVYFFGLSEAFKEAFPCKK